METAEKSFTVSDEIMLPTGAALGQLCCFDTAPQVDERRVVGNKAVFKGTLCVHALYKTPEGRMQTVSQIVPFSQYCELSGEYDDGEAQITMAVTGAQLEPDAAQPEQKLCFAVQLLAQCTVSCMQSVTLLEDAYAIGAFKSGSSVNPQTTEDVDAVVDELKAQKPLVQAYVMDEIFDKMIGGEAAVGVYYSGDAITMIDDNPDLAWVFPEEGTVLSVDSMAIPATSEHEEAAEMFINFMCAPDVGKANIEYIGYTTPMHCVWDILDEDLKYSEIAYPSEDIAAKEEVFTALSDEVNSELDVKWSEMKSYDEGGSSLLFLSLLAAMVALACFNIWRKLRKKSRNQY